MPRSDKSISLEWIGLMKKELDKLRARIDWLERGLSYIEIHIQQEKE